ncbi:MAG TPA: 2-keto-3-deoxygluconate permease [Bacillota bacterium]|nr:2-keto-3-deoxygluconate permease [Bacillota bacterium]HPL53912.1 2-keto-3-deoxygluconate permease [Bacillota bacterium]
MKILQTVRKVPGGLMVVPLFLGAIANLLFPEALSIGGMTTATFKSGAGSFIGASLVCVGSQITITRIGEPLKRGFVLLLAKFLAGFIPTLIVSKIFGPYGVLGLTPLMLLAAITNSNGGMYLGLMSQYGDENDMGAQSLLGINDGPFLTLVGMGLSGVASFDAVALLASVVPLIVGIILGNLDHDIRDFLEPGIMFTLPFLAFCLGTGLNLKNIVTGGFTGIFLGLVVVALSALFIFPADRYILKRPGYAAFAICTTAGNAVAVPAILAQADPSLASQVESATAAVATAVIVTAIIAPILTSWAVKKYGCPRLNNIPDK